MQVAAEVIQAIRHAVAKAAGTVAQQFARLLSGSRRQQERDSRAERGPERDPRGQEARPLPPYVLGGRGCRGTATPGRADAHVCGIAAPVEAARLCDARAPGCELCRAGHVWRSLLLMV
jgi:hypothetical protein